MHEHGRLSHGAEHLVGAEPSAEGHVSADAQHVCQSPQLRLLFATTDQFELHGDPPPAERVHGVDDVVVALELHEPADRQHRVRRPPGRLKRRVIRIQAAVLHVELALQAREDAVVLGADIAPVEVADQEDVVGVQHLLGQMYRGSVQVCVGARVHGERDAWVREAVEHVRASRDIAAPIGEDVIVVPEALRPGPCFEREICGLGERGDAVPQRPCLELDGIAQEPRKPVQALPAGRTDAGTERDVVHPIAWQDPAHSSGSSG